MSDTLDNRFHFDRAHVEDLPAISSLAAGTVLGSHRAVPLDVMEAWMRKNPEVLHVLRRGDEIVGYVCMCPVPVIQNRTTRRGIESHRYVKKELCLVPEK